MSRIGTQPIAIPHGVTCTLNGRELIVKGPKGELHEKIPSELTVHVTEGELRVVRKGETEKEKALHGLTRMLLQNAVNGVCVGYETRLELEGTGYRVKKEQEKLILTLGFSHPVVVEPTPGVTYDVEGEKEIIIRGIDKQRVGQTAANVRMLRPPEPYKGKGIRYKGEVVRRKPGKAAKVGQAVGGAPA